MIHPMQFEADIVRPTLNILARFNENLAIEPAVTLMMGTAAQESDLGFFLRQHPSGPAKGWWQVEDATHADVWRYLQREENIELARLVLGLSRHKTVMPPHSEMINNPLYSCAIARIKYWMVPAPLPVDLDGLAEYWDRYFNCNANHGTVADFLESYRDFILGEDSGPGRH